MSKVADNLLSRHPLITDQIETEELRTILKNLEFVLDQGVEGDIVEFGCFEGTASLFLQRMIQTKQSDKSLWVYDSFDGLPDKTKEDESPLGIDFKRGELRSTKAKFIENFRKAQLPLPRITKKWFHEITDSELPDTICLAFLDGDYYRSIRTSLELVLPRMAPGGIIAVDDYDNASLPGVRKAVEHMTNLNNYSKILEKGVFILRRT